MSAPERIWVEDERAEGGGIWLHEGRPSYQDEYIREYVRADLPPSLEACLAHPEVKALVGLLHQAVTTRAADDMEWQIDTREALARIKDAKP